jgi:hypothetical protein
MERLRIDAAIVPGSSPNVFRELPSLRRMSSCNASPAFTATSPFTNGWNAQHGIRTEMSYVPAARFVSVYRPSGFVIARTMTPVALFFAWTGASATAPFGPETTPVKEPLTDWL